MDTPNEYRPRYGNWVSSKVIILLFVCFLLLLFGAEWTAASCRWLSVVMMVSAFLVLIVTMLFLRARTALSYEGGGIQRRVLESMLDQAKAAGWDGKGKMLDIGCGSGALCVMAAKREPKVMVTGIDQWKSHWEYSKAQCEANAQAEGVANRILFRQEDAAKLPFVNGMFDLVVSNLTFHQVRTQKDKQALMREALRTVKPGGIFVMQDTFYSKRLYGDPESFVQSLAPYVSEIHLVDHRKMEDVPKYLHLPFFLGQMGMIWGRVKG